MVSTKAVCRFAFLLLGINISRNQQLRGGEVLTVTSLQDDIMHSIYVRWWTRHNEQLHEVWAHDYNQHNPTWHCIAYSIYYSLCMALPLPFMRLWSKGNFRYEHVSLAKALASCQRECASGPPLRPQEILFLYNPTQQSLSHSSCIQSW